MLTFLFSVLAPTLTRALEYQQGKGSTIEICSTSGSKLIQLDSQGEPRSTPAKAALDHCLFCVTHSPLYALPASGTLMPAASSGRAPYPARYYSAAVTAHAWSAAYPRAPPAVA